MNAKNRSVSYFMLGFQRIFIIIRSQIRSPYNIRLLEEISKYCLALKDEGEVEFEIFKAEINREVSDSIEVKEFVGSALEINCTGFVTDNLSEINYYLSVISDAAIETCKQLRHKNFDRAYDLVDAIHCLPEAIMNKKQWNSKQFWKTYITPYREKWDIDFLGNREKEAVKH